MWLFPTPTLFIPFTNPYSLGRLIPIQRLLGPTRENKWSKIFDKKPPHMDSSIVFARLRQCASTLTHASLGPPESVRHTASRSVQPFCKDRDRDRQTDRQTTVVRP